MRNRKRPAAIIAAFLLSLTACDMLDNTAPAPVDHYVAGAELGRLTIQGDRWDFRANPTRLFPEVAPHWDGGVHLAGVVLGTYSEPDGHGLIIRTTYVGQIMPAGEERPRGMDFLFGGRWAEEVNRLPLTDSAAGPVGGWVFHREYADLLPPRLP